MVFLPSSSKRELEINHEQHTYAVDGLLLMVVKARPCSKGLVMLQRQQLMFSSRPNNFINAIWFKFHCFKNVTRYHIWTNLIKNMVWHNSIISKFMFNMISNFFQKFKNFIMNLHITRIEYENETHILYILVCVYGEFIIAHICALSITSSAFIFHLRTCLLKVFCLATRVWTLVVNTSKPFFLVKQTYPFGSSIALPCINHPRRWWEIDL